MRLFSREDLHALLQSSGGYHLSLFLPTHSVGPETEQDPIRFKNLIRRAEEDLEADGVRTPTIKSILDPAYQLLNTPFFWKHQRKGLAVFIGPSGMEYFRVPHVFPELAVVTQRFHVNPILPLLSWNEQFNILAFSPTLVRFFQCDRDNIEQIEIEEMPKNFKDANGKNDNEQHLHYHYMGSGGKGDQTSVIHGSGELSEKDLLKKYYRKIDYALQKALRDSKAPLLLASTETNVALYREVNTYPSLFENSINGNPDEMEPNEILQKGFPLVRPLFKKERTDAEEHYQKLVGTGRTSDTVEELFQKSRQGVIDTLFVARGIEQWGIVDEKEGTLQLHDHYESGDEDIYSYISIQTVLHKGIVFSMMPQFMPDKKNITAILRY
ncbi:MAG: hypothetical protein PHI40_02520 [Caldisericia bacterium]|nr:hypothetical protein [Caldisericia bacterium]MDD4614267.1 hypothetical protein [Caldisericia bacterium]